MHPSLAHKYRLRSADDIGLAERMTAAAKKAGWTDRQIESVLRCYGDMVPELDSGRLDPSAALQQLSDFASSYGVSDGQCVALLEWHGSTVEFMSAHSGELPPLAPPAPAAIATELAVIETIQRENPDRYWREPALQNRMYDLLELSHGHGAGVAPAVQVNPAVSARLGEIEGMMGDRNSPYWSGATAPALQAEYRNIVSGTGQQSVGTAQISPGGAADQAASGDGM